MLGMTFNFWVAALMAIVLVAAFGTVIERFLLRQLPGQQMAQVLVTLGISFIVADFCLMVWGGDPVRVDTPESLTGSHALRPAGVPALPAGGHRHRRGGGARRSGCCSTARGSAP